MKQEDNQKKPQTGTMIKGIKLFGTKPNKLETKVIDNKKEKVEKSSSDIDSEVIGTKNLTEFFNDFSSIKENDFEISSVGLNFFSFSKQYLYISISLSLSMPQERQMPYIENVRKIENLTYIKNQSTNSNQVNSQQVTIEYLSHNKNEYFMKRKSIKFQSGEKDKEKIKLAISFIEENYNEFCNMRVFSSSPFGQFPVSFHIIFLSNLNILVTELLVAGSIKTIQLKSKIDAQELFIYLIQLSSAIYYQEFMKIHYFKLRKENLSCETINGNQVLKIINLDNLKTNQTSISPYDAPEILSMINNSDAHKNIDNLHKSQEYSMGVLLLKFLHFFDDQKIGMSFEEFNNNKESEIGYLKVITKLEELWGLYSEDKLMQNIIQIVNICLSYYPKSRISSKNILILTKNLDSKSSECLQNEYENLLNNEDLSSHIQAPLNANQSKENKNELEKNFTQENNRNENKQDNYSNLFSELILKLPKMKQIVETFENKIHIDKQFAIKEEESKVKLFKSKLDEFNGLHEFNIVLDKIIFLSLENIVKIQNLEANLKEKNQEIKNLYNSSSELTKEFISIKKDYAEIKKQMNNNEINYKEASEKGTLKLNEIVAENGNLKRDLDDKNKSILESKKTINELLANMENLQVIIENYKNKEQNIIKPAEVEGIKKELTRSLEINEKFEGIIVELTRKSEELKEALNTSKFQNTELNLEVLELKKELKRLTEQNLNFDQELKLFSDQNIKLGKEMENFHKMYDEKELENSMLREEKKEEKKKSNEIKKDEKIYDKISLLEREKASLMIQLNLKDKQFEDLNNRFVENTSILSEILGSNRQGNQSIPSREQEINDLRMRIDSQNKDLAQFQKLNNDLIDRNSKFENENGELNAALDSNRNVIEKLISKAEEDKKVYDAKFIEENIFLRELNDQLQNELTKSNEEIKKLKEELTNKSKK